MKKEAKKTQVSEQLCKQVELMRRGGANQTQIGKLLEINPCTVSRIETAGFIYEVYVEQQKARREDEKKKREQEARTEIKAEDAKAPIYIEDKCPGQMEMDLTITKPDMSDQTKMMLFQAAQVDKLIMKLDQIYNMASMILRAIRKE